MRFCWSCGGDADEPDHWRSCDGRQGRIEAEAETPESETYDAWARNDDPEPSHVAAAAVNAKALEGKVIGSLEHDPALTTEEITRRLGHPHRDSISPRMRSLERKGFVERVGKRRNESGLLATAWGLTALGRTKLP